MKRLLLVLTIITNLSFFHAAYVMAQSPAQAQQELLKLFAEYSELFGKAVPGDPELRQLGLQHGSAEALYRALKDQAGDKTRLGWNEIPDWGGLYTRDGFLLPKVGPVFDSNQSQDVPTSAKLTPEYSEKLMAKRKAMFEGQEFDPLSSCLPPTHPRWLTTPFMREHVVTPDITILISEYANSIRRIYTDGREHLPEEDRYPLYFGDSIGFWDDDKLVVHTNQLTAGQYTRGQPDYSEQVETVEIWQKHDDDTLIADVWVYDPPSLLEPWYVRQSYKRIPNPDKTHRVRYFNCNENPNNTVNETTEGGSEHGEFEFDE